jgi:DNA polymerase-3 subunit gamma/tau
MFHQQGARKKKGLTDLVEIISFPDQNLRSKAPKAVSKPKISEERVSVHTRPQPKEMATPGIGLSSSSLSIKKMMAPKTEEGEGVDLSSMPHEPFTIDDLKMAWRRFAFVTKDEGKETFYSALTRRPPVVKSEHTFVLEVDNQVQIDYINPQLSDLLSFLRKTLRNYSINVILELTKHPEEEVKFLTGKDKFASMARKNPNLHTLKSIFNLDIEY